MNSRYVSIKLAYLVCWIDSERIVRQKIYKIYKIIRV